MAGADEMSDKRLAEIRGRVANVASMQEVGPADLADLEPWQVRAIAAAYAEDVPTLLAEVERLRAALAAAAAREAAMVAKNNQAMVIVEALDALGWDAFIGRELSQQARALLASAEQEGGGDGA